MDGLCQMSFKKQIKPYAARDLQPSDILFWKWWRQKPEPKTT